MYPTANYKSGLSGTYCRFEDYNSATFATATVNTSVLIELKDKNGVVFSNNVSLSAAGDLSLNTDPADGYWQFSTVGTKEAIAWRFNSSSTYEIDAMRATWTTTWTNTYEIRLNVDNYGFLGEFNFIVMPYAVPTTQDPSAYNYDSVWSGISYVDV